MDSVKVCHELLRGDNLPSGIPLTERLIFINSNFSEVSI